MHDFLMSWVFIIFFVVFFVLIPYGVGLLIQTVAGWTAPSAYFIGFFTLFSMYVTGKFYVKAFE